MACGGLGGEGEAGLFRTGAFFAFCFCFWAPVIFSAHDLSSGNSVEFLVFGLWLLSWHRYPFFGLGAVVAKARLSDGKEMI